MNTQHSQAWIITGASSGLGKSIALAALREGHSVIGTTRNPSPPAKDEFTELGGTWLTLDVTHPDTANTVAHVAQQHNIDVVVNCAGYAQLGAVEDVSDTEFHDQFEANVHGPLRILRGVLPVLRAKRSGVVVNISSGAGFTGRPGRGPYSASKFALEGISESLFHELQPLGVRVLLVEPGAFRTPFSDSAQIPAAYAQGEGVSDGYKGTPAHEMVGLTKTMSSRSDLVKGDPDRAATAIVNAVLDHDFKALRLPLGNDCIKAYEGKLQWMKDDLELTRAIASATDYSP
ncbi:hypothetical protein FH972_022398 [Carpinus fangiana]|uniref:Uncharacterized protein n=1 Tax=Carpinus fangiana TaxID=176857 RepID=A0A5N6KSH5_9ROSI|nr:hypothetical protein FH972_022398 [Carpinus fangiana]